MTGHVLPEDVGDEEFAQMTERMYYRIFPNTPVTKEETAAFERACLLQIAHERESAGTVPALPPGVKSFQIGHFSMNFSETAAQGNSPGGLNLCAAAYGVLLRAGLLYRGVEREAWHQDG